MICSSLSTLTKDLPLSLLNYSKKLPIRSGICTRILRSEDSSPTVSKRLWEEFRREALFALYHPFVVCLAAGNLDMHSFQKYVVQDAFFLNAFAQAYEMAMHNAREQQIKSEISQLQQNTYEELKLHSSLMKDWNVDMSHSHPYPATSAYTEFLLAVGAGQYEQFSSYLTDDKKPRLAALTLGAMTPCMRLYAFLGQHISQACSTREDHPFHDWISTYSSPEFEMAAAQIEQLLDKMVIEEDFPTLKTLYQRAVNYEVEFFNAQDVNGTSNVPLIGSVLASDCNVVLVSDFDSTCTVSDSSPVIGELGMVNDDIRNKWKSVSDAYMKEYYQILDRVFRLSTDGDYHYENLRKAMEIISDYEREGNSRVVASKVFQGIKLEDIKQAGQNMPLQAGFANCFKRLNSIPCHILSVCWSQTLIESVLSKEDIKTVMVHSNELNNDGRTCDGNLIRRIETPLDKEKVLYQKILSSSSTDKQPFVIYIGDSLTDLLCLLRADIGIVVGNSSSLERATHAFHVKMIPLLQGVIDQKNGWKKQDGVLYRASGWLEIEAFLLGQNKGSKC